MDRIKRISSEVLERYPDKFGTDFDQNKKTIKDIAAVRSKVLRNRVAGYITSYIRRQDANNIADTSSEETEKELKIIEE